MQIGLGFADIGAAPRQVRGQTDRHHIGQRWHRRGAVQFGAQRLGLAAEQLAELVDTLRDLQLEGRHAARVAVDCAMALLTSTSVVMPAARRCCVSSSSSSMVARFSLAMSRRACAPRSSM